jgi:hypothetical protein
MPDLEQPSYEELAAQNAELTARVAELLAVVAEQVALIEALRAEVATPAREGLAFTELRLTGRLRADTSSKHTLMARARCRPVRRVRRYIS